MSVFSWLGKRSSQLSDEPAVRDYLDHFRSAIPKRCPVRELPFAVIDTETTGLDPAKDELISMACYRVTGMNMDLSDRLECTIRRRDYQPGTHTRIHGMMAKHLETGSSEQEVLLALLEFIRGHILVGHHIAFDTRFLNKALLRHFNVKLKNKSLDTARLASRLEKPVLENAGTESLDTLCARYSISPLQRHTAAGDAYMTALLFLKLLGRLEKRGVTTYRDLMR